MISNIINNNKNNNINNMNMEYPNMNNMNSIAITNISISIWTSMMIQWLRYSIMIMIRSIYILFLQLLKK